MDIKEVHDRVLHLLDKDLVGYVSHEEIDSALHAAQMAEYFDLFGNYQEYQYGRPQARKAYGVTSIVQSVLSPFIKPHAIAFVDSLADPPAAIEVITSVETAGGAEVDVINETQVAARLRSQIVAPSTSKPVIYRSSNKLRLLPDDMNVTLTVWALTKPVKPKFAYTLSGRVLTYDQNSSTQLVWGEIGTERIINRAVSNLSQKIQSPEGIQYAEMKNKEGL